MLPVGVAVEVVGGVAAEGSKPCEWLPLIVWLPLAEAPVGRGAGVSVEDCCGRWACCRVSAHQPLPDLARLASCACTYACLCVCLSVCACA